MIVQPVQAFGLVDRKRGKNAGAPAFFSCCGSNSVQFLANVPLPPNLSGLSRAELESLLVELFGKVAALEKTASEQRVVSQFDRRLDYRPRWALRPSIKQALELLLIPI